MSTLSYEIVDVFTDRPFTGNPLAVVFGGDDLGRDQMQALAREFHLSETVFVLPPTVDGATYRARIFTPEEELPFAGHPSVGAAVTQMRRGLFRPGLVFQECGAGVLPIDVEDGSRATLTGGRPMHGPAVDPDPLLSRRWACRSPTSPDRSPASPDVDWTLPICRCSPDAVARARIAAASGGRGRCLCVRLGSRCLRVPCPRVRAGQGRSRGSGDRLRRPRVRGVARRLRSAACRTESRPMWCVRAPSSTGRPRWSAP